MMTIGEYVRMLLKKKKMSNMDLVRAINKVEEASGVKERTVRQNVNSYLTKERTYTYNTVRKVELALDLEKGTLVNLLPKPKTQTERKELKEAMVKWKK